MALKHKRFILDSRDVYLCDYTGFIESLIESVENFKGKSISAVKFKFFGTFSADMMSSKSPEGKYEYHYTVIDVIAGYYNDNEKITSGVYKMVFSSEGLFRSFFHIIRNFENVEGDDILDRTYILSSEGKDLLDNGNILEGRDVCIGKHERFYKDKDEELDKGNMLDSRDVYLGVYSDSIIGSAVKGKSISAVKFKFASDEMLTYEGKYGKYYTVRIHVIAGYYNNNKKIKPSWGYRMAFSSEGLFRSFYRILRNIEDMEGDNVLDSITYILGSEGKDFVGWYIIGEPMFMIQKVKIL